jgi:arylsulfatase A-like enzyme
MIITAGLCLVGAAQKPGKPFNVLFIAADDLRPELGCYGVSQIQTPAIDRLAERGVLFQNAYCQSAICAPSRASLLTGLRPDLSGVNDLVTSVREKNPDIVTLPQLFKNHGYNTVSIGKVYHNSPRTRDPKSWSEKEWSPKGGGAGRGYLAPDNIRLAEAGNGIAAPYEMADVEDTAYSDGKKAAYAIQWLKQYGNQKPFFLAVGFDRPHLPFNAPKKYWDLYDSARIALPEEVYAGVTNNGIDKSLPRFPDFGNSWGEITQYSGIDKKRPIDPVMAKMLKWGYYASTSYMDAQVGCLLQALQDEGLADNTIVVLWGDHGYKLGEYGGWAKHTNLEIDTRSPLIIYVPKGKGNGKKANGLVEFIDIYPTLAELAGLPVPSHVQGKSLVPVLHHPETSIKEAAFSQFTDWNKVFKGYSVRTPAYRYTAWFSLKGQDSGRLVGQELYAHPKDKQERINLAASRKHKKTVEQLREMVIRENRLQQFVR